MRNLKYLALILALSPLSSLHAADETGLSKITPPTRPVANAAEMKPSIAVFGGIADTQAHRRNGTNYGVEYGWQPYLPYGAAIELSGYVSDHKGIEPTLTRTRLFGKANYNFGGTIPVIKDSYVGLGLGPVWDNFNHHSDIEFGIAPQIGFDLPVTGTPLTLGLNANYMFVGGAKPDVFALNGMAKYWF
jgi:hypothetical protein